jgi:hypothetical protein
MISPNPAADDNLQRLPDGRLALVLPNPWADGAAAAFLGLWTHPDLVAQRLQLEIQAAGLLVTRFFAAHPHAKARLSPMPDLIESHRYTKLDDGFFVDMVIDHDRREQGAPGPTSLCHALKGVLIQGGAMEGGRQFLSRLFARRPELNAGNVEQAVAAVVQKCLPGTREEQNALRLSAMIEPATADIPKKSLRL